MPSMVSTFLRLPTMQYLLSAKVGLQHLLYDAFAYGWCLKVPSVCVYCVKKVQAKREIRPVSSSFRKVAFQAPQMVDELATIHLLSCRKNGSSSLKLFVACKL